ncbi:MAG: MATE family efflux transporter [bacterium]
MKKNLNNSKLTEGRIIPTLSKMTMQMAVGMIGMIGFNLIDTFFIGRLGADPLAAIGFTFPVVLGVNSIALGMGIAASSIISRAIGRREFDEAARKTNDILLFSFSTVVILAAAGLLTINPLFTLLGAGNDILQLISRYMSIWYFGVPFVVIPMTGNNIIRATGDAKTPAFIMLSSMTINAILDPLFIFGLWHFPRMEIAGAALATVIARSVAMIITLLILAKREHLLKPVKPVLSHFIETSKEMLYIGIPASATRFILPLSMAIITRMLSSFGNYAVAGFGVATRIEMFALLLVNSAGSILAPFTGQNYGAGRFERIKKAVRFLDVSSIIWGFLLLIIFIPFARPIASLFNDNPEITGITAMYLLIISFTYGFQGILRLTVNAFNALNKPLHGASLSIFRMFIIYIPLALILKEYFSIRGIFIAGAIANIISGITAYFFLLSTLNKLKESS